MKYRNILIKTITPLALLFMSSVGFAEGDPTYELIQNTSDVDSSLSITEYELDADGDLIPVVYDVIISDSLGSGDKVLSFDWEVDILGDTSTFATKEGARVLKSTDSENASFSIAYDSSTASTERITATSDIDNDFVGISSGILQGGAVYIDSETTISSISANFISNSTTASILGVDGYEAAGGAIYNAGTVTTISGVFVDNDAGVDINILTTGGAYQSYGGAIYNAGSIDYIYADFIGNSAADNGGAIATSGDIGTISGDFIGNTAKSTGGAIYISGGDIDLIEGTFIANTVLRNNGSAIYIDKGNVDKIDADFISNVAYNSGVLYLTSTSTVGEIYGDFISNVCYGYGAIMNNGKITYIESDFIGNYAASNGGAIYNTNIITTIVGDFIENHSDASSSGGGAIYNSKTISSIEGNFINNSSITVGGAITNYGGAITLTASEGTSYMYIGNYASADDLIDSDDDAKGGFLRTVGSSVTEFATAKDSLITIGDGTAGYDSIASNNANSTINKTGSGTLTVNSSMKSFTGTFNLNEGTFNLANVFGGTLKITEYTDFNVIISAANVGQTVLLGSISLVDIADSNDFTSYEIDVSLNLSDLASLLGTETTIFDDSYLDILSLNISDEYSSEEVYVKEDSSNIVVIADSVSVATGDTDEISVNVAKNDDNEVTLTVSTEKNETTDSYAVDASDLDDYDYVYVEGNAALSLSGGELSTQINDEDNSTGTVSVDASDTSESITSNVDIYAETFTVASDNTFESTEKTDTSGDTAVIYAYEYELGDNATVISGLTDVSDSTDKSKGITLTTGKNVSLYGSITSNSPLVVESKYTDGSVDSTLTVYGGTITTSYDGEEDIITIGANTNLVLAINDEGTMASIVKSGKITVKDAASITVLIEGSVDMLIGDTYEIADDTTVSNNSNIADLISVNEDSSNGEFSLATDGSFNLRVDALTNFQDTYADESANVLALATALDGIENDGVDTDAKREFKTDMYSENLNSYVMNNYSYIAEVNTMLLSNQNFANVNRARSILEKSAGVQIEDEDGSVSIENEDGTVSVVDASEVSLIKYSNVAQLQVISLMGNKNASNGVAGYDYYSVGSTANFDEILSENALIGASIGGTYNKVTGDAGDNANSTTFLLNAYAVYAYEGFEFFGNIGYAHFWNEGSKAGSGSADWDSDAFNFLVGASYKMETTVDGLSISPVAMLNLVCQDADSASYSNGVTVDDQSYFSAKLMFGFEVEYAINAQFNVLARAMYSHEMGDTSYDNTYSLGFVNGVNYIGSEAGADSAVMGLGLSYDFSETCTAYFDYNAYAYTSLITHSLNLSVAFKF